LNESLKEFSSISRIGMRAEQLATEIYYKELDGVKPSLVRFIEYYPPTDFLGNIFPNGFAEQRMELCFSQVSLLGRVFGKKPEFNGFIGTPNRGSGDIPA
jgi:hypothetical protein